VSTGETPGARPRHVVVIGASLAGLVTARAVAEHADRVTVLDRDDLPRSPETRGGVPQGRHTHAMLDRGTRLLEGWFPGLSDDLAARGARTGDAGLAGWWHFRPEPLARTETGLTAILVSRPLLEWYVRGRLLADWRGRVELREDTAVLDLAFDRDERRVVGVVVADRDGGAPSLVPADLVVDASGRTSRTPQWLERRGYGAPLEEVRRVDKRYSTFRVRSAADGSTPLAIAVAARPEVSRSGIMLGQEGGEHIVSLVGRGDDQPPLEWPAYVEYARTLAAPTIAEALAPLRPVGPASTYRFPANRRRHYERMRRFPTGLVVTGDAFCSFDPVYGQGMSVAAVEADQLAWCLAAGTDDLARRFHRAASAVVDTPWTIAAGSVPDEAGRVPRRMRAIGAYLDAYLRAAADDPVLAAEFLRVNHLRRAPSDLMRPALAARVLRGAWTRRASARPTLRPVPARTVERSSR
jgi:2-polyprenyl-6-methoxyphenol hydroxylase-like FAD-dependent oxidoreductase